MIANIPNRSEKILVLLMHSISYKDSSLGVVPFAGVRPLGPLAGAGFAVPACRYSAGGILGNFMNPAIVCPRYKTLGSDCKALHRSIRKPTRRIRTPTTRSFFWKAHVSEALQVRRRCGPDMVTCRRRRSSTKRCCPKASEGLGVRRALKLFWGPASCHPGKRRPKSAPPNTDRVHG